LLETDHNNRDEPHLLRAAFFLEGLSTAAAAMLLRAAGLLLLAAARAGAQQPLSPSCALNGLPCAPPRWAPTWNLTQSTVIEPGHTAGYFDPGHTFGLVSLDWSVARGTWFSGNTSNTTCEAAHRENCRLLKAAGKVTRCFGYHNTELALEWLESQRAIMRDPRNKDLFLQYQPGNPSGIPPGTVLSLPNTYGDQLFWNHTNTRAQLVFIQALLAVVTADDSLDGSFTDDVDGLPAEHPTVPAALGMTADDVAALRFATQSMGSALIAALTLNGRYTWQAFGSHDTSSPHAAATTRRGRAYVGITPATCASFMRTFCAAEYQARPMLMHMSVATPVVANATLAAFLITRPPYGYLGFAWESNDANFTSLFYLSVGEPTALCVEAPTGVFSRAWTRGTPSLDCNTWEASLPFAALPGVL